MNERRKGARAASEAWENGNQYDIPFSFIRAPNISLLHNLHRPLNIYLFLLTYRLSMRLMASLTQYRPIKIYIGIITSTDQKVSTSGLIVQIYFLLLLIISHITITEMRKALVPKRPNFPMKKSPPLLPGGNKRYIRRISAIN